MAGAQTLPLLGAGSPPATGGGGATWTFVADKSAFGQNGPITTAATDMTGGGGADLILACVTNGGGTATPPVSSPANTFTQIGSTQTNGTGFKTSLWYKQAPSVTSSMTFSTASNASLFANIIVQGFHGSAATPADQTSGQNNTSASTIQPAASITPSSANELVVECLGTNDGGSTAFTINGSYTIGANSKVAQTGANQGGAMAYWAQTTATATQPTWTDGNSGINGLNTVIGSFK